MHQASVGIPPIVVTREKNAPNAPKNLTYHGEADLPEREGLATVPQGMGPLLALVPLKSGEVLLRPFMEEFVGF